MKALAGILVVVFIVLAGLAFAHPLDPTIPLAKALGFANDKPHIKHAIAYFVLALLSLVWIRFQSNAAKT